MASRLKSEFSTSVPLTVQWDRKLMEDLTGKEQQQSLPAYKIGISWIEWWPFALTQQRPKQVSTPVLAHIFKINWRDVCSASLAATM